ncbi:hypothetical protein F66182_12305, partial [Fusarium sp. NRRL 66182]
GLVGRPDQWSYRIPFALQWIWPLPLMIVCFFAPESPWYLVRHDRLEEAKHSLRRLGGNKTEEQINGQLAMLVHTAKIESSLEVGKSYLDCFKGTDLRRTEICCLAFVGQIMSSSSFAYSPSYFFTTAVSLARVSYQIINIVSQVLEPYFMNPTAWNASGKTGFFWGGTALIIFVWSYFRLPEAKGRTYEELDIIFARKVSARKFASQEVDAYAARDVVDTEKE